VASARVHLAKLAATSPPAGQILGYLLHELPLLSSTESGSHWDLLTPVAVPGFHYRAIAPTFKGPAGSIQSALQLI